MKSELKLKAIKLREAGLSIKQISKELNVAKSSVSIWVRNVKLTDKQIKNLEKQNPIFNNQLCGATAKANAARTLRLQYQAEGKQKAKEQNLLHQAGCMLYWSEGSKNKNRCTFTNSDTNMMKLFVKFLRKCFNIPNDKLTVSITCYTNNGLSKSDIENYWINSLELNKDNLRKGKENIRPKSATNSIRHNKLIYGVCRLEVKQSTQLIQHIYGAIQTYGEFENNFGLM